MRVRGQRRRGRRWRRRRRNMAAPRLVGFADGEFCKTRTRPASDRWRIETEDLVTVLRVP